MLCPHCGGELEHSGIRSLQESYVFRCKQCGRQVQRGADEVKEG